MGCCQAPARDPSAAVSPPSKRRRLEAGAVSASPAIAAPLADAQTDRQQQQEQQQPPQQPLQPQQPQLPKHLQQPRQQLNEQHPRQQVLQSRENLPQLWQPQEQECCHTRPPLPGGCALGLPAGACTEAGGLCADALAGRPSEPLGGRSAAGVFFGGAARSHRCRALPLRPTRRGEVPAGRGVFFGGAARSHRCRALPLRPTRRGEVPAGRGTALHSRGGYRGITGVACGSRQGARRGGH
mmetsp:Transcript_76675/g.248164  ORF Transcript_76675/g.248164 Transcript_76675/m.248164 type:complete len:240 (+) Transcript_76675:45-764(+)